MRRGDPGPAPRTSLAWAWRALQVRARFLVALALASAVVGRWDVLRTHWDRWTGPAARDPAMGAVSADTEYFCPMDPGVVSSWPGDCPVCSMALVRRKVGDMGPTPEGVVARVQLSPSRVQLAGIRTEPAAYRPLAREIRTVGAVEGATVAAEVAGDEASWLAAGMAAEVEPDPPDGSAAIAGRLRAVEGRRVVAELPSPAGLGPYASIVVRVPLADRDPFRAQPRGAPPIREGEPRYINICPDHPEVLRVEPGPCPKDGLPLERRPLAADQRVSWWCPMHPAVTAPEPGRRCDACGGMALVPRVVSYCPEGAVLAVPESAVIDTGTRRVVYIEAMPGIFDGVEVRLGPRCGAYYPVVSGLDAGQAVAASGAFLIDAETRLNPSLAVGYFGARTAAAATTGAKAAAPAPAPAEGRCPVTGKRLGSMGPPFELRVDGRTVRLCCEGCKAAVLASPGKYLPPAHDP